MAWKLKKSTPGKDAPDQAPPSASAQTIDYATLGGAQSMPVDEAFSPVDESGPDSDFFSSRMEAADAAVDSFHSAKQSAGAAKTSEQDDWSLDAFAPYQPPEPFDFSEPAGSGAYSAGLNGSATHSGVIDFAAEPESVLGAHDSEPTILHSTPLAPSEFGVVDLGEGDAAGDTDTDAAAAAPLMSETETNFAFAPVVESGTESESAALFADDTELADDPEESWQLGEAGALDDHEAEGVSAEPIALGDAEQKADDFEFAPLSGDAAAAVSIMPFVPEPAFEERGGTLSPMQAESLSASGDAASASIPVELASADKTLLYGEAADEPAARPAAARPQLVVRFGPFRASYPVGHTDVVIGRPDPNTGIAPDISLEYDDAVSRRHARVYRDGDQVALEDLGSKNGTYLNGAELPPNHPVPLKPGDTVRIGERTEIAFEQ